MRSIASNFNEAFSFYHLECVFTVDLTYIKVRISYLFFKRRLFRFEYYNNAYNLKDHTIWSNLTNSE